MHLYKCIHSYIIHWIFSFNISAPHERSIFSHIECSNALVHSSVQLNFRSMTELPLNDRAFFFMVVKNRNGLEYEAGDLSSLATSLYRHIHDCGKEYFILMDKEFQGCRQNIKSKEENVRKAGKRCCFEIQCIINKLIYSCTTYGLQFTLTLVFHLLKILTYAHEKSPHVTC